MAAKKYEKSSEVPSTSSQAGPSTSSQAGPSTSFQAGPSIRSTENSEMEENDLTDAQKKEDEEYHRVTFDLIKKLVEITGQEDIDDFYLNHVEGRPFLNFGRQEVGPTTTVVLDEDSKSSNSDCQELMIVDSDSPSTSSSIGQKVSARSLKGTIAGLEENKRNLIEELKTLKKEKDKNTFELKQMISQLTCVARNKDSKLRFFKDQAAIYMEQITLQETKISDLEESKRLLDVEKKRKQEESEKEAADLKKIIVKLNAVVKHRDSKIKNFNEQASIYLKQITTQAAIIEGLEEAKRILSEEIKRKQAEQDKPALKLKKIIIKLTNIVKEKHAHNKDLRYQVVVVKEEKTSQEIKIAGLEMDKRNLGEEVKRVNGMRDNDVKDLQVKIARLTTILKEKDEKIVNGLKNFREKATLFLAIKASDGSKIVELEQTNLNLTDQVLRLEKMTNSTHSLKKRIGELTKELHLKNACIRKGTIEYNVQAAFFIDERLNQNAKISELKEEKKNLRAQVKRLQDMKKIAADELNKRVIELTTKVRNKDNAIKLGLKDLKKKANILLDDKAAKEKRIVELEEDKRQLTEAMKRLQQLIAKNLEAKVNEVQELVKEAVQGVIHIQDPVTEDQDAGAVQKLPKMPKLIKIDNKTFSIHKVAEILDLIKQAKELKTAQDVVEVPNPVQEGEDPKTVQEVVEIPEPVEKFKEPLAVQKVVQDLNSIKGEIGNVTIQKVNVCEASTFGERTRKSNRPKAPKRCWAEGPVEVTPGSFRKDKRTRRQSIWISRSLVAPSKSIHPSKDVKEEPESSQKEEKNDGEERTMEKKDEEAAKCK